MSMNGTLRGFVLLFTLDGEQRWNLKFRDRASGVRGIKGQRRWAGKAYFKGLNVVENPFKGRQQSLLHFALILTSWGQGHTEDGGVEWRLADPRRLADQGWDPTEWLCLWGPSQSLKEEGGLWGEVIVRVKNKPLAWRSQRESDWRTPQEKFDFYIILKEDLFKQVCPPGMRDEEGCVHGEGVPVHHQPLDPGIPPIWGLSCQQDDPQGPGGAVATDARSPSSMGLISCSQYHPVLPEPSTCLLFPCSPSYFD